MLTFIWTATSRSYGPPNLLFQAIDEFLASASPASRLSEMFWWRVCGGWSRRIVGTGWVLLG